MINRTKDTNNKRDRYSTKQIQRNNDEANNDSERKENQITQKSNSHKIRANAKPLSFQVAIMPSTRDLFIQTTKRTSTVKMKDNNVIKIIITPK